MESSILDIIIQQGGMLGLGVFAFFMLNRVWAQYVEAERSHGDQRAQIRLEGSRERSQMWEMTREALNRNTEAMVKQTETLVRLCESLKKG